MKLLRIFFLLTLIYFSRGDTMAQVKNTVGNTAIVNQADSTQLKYNTVIIGDILFQGNKKTKSFIIQRELPFLKGDQFLVTDLPRLLKIAQQQVMNTSLFVDVKVSVTNQKDSIVTITVDTKERWYLFPLPYFRLIDRNFNQWLVEQKASLERVNYGIKFIQNNVSGRNDNLDIWLITGYTQQFTIRYNLPFFDKKLKSGFNIGFLSATQKELNYATGDNKQLFYKQEETVKKIQRYDFTYSYRPGVKQRHYFRISYNNEEVADTILKINPLYFPEKKNRLSYLDFSYQFKYYNADYNSYPTKGYLLEGNIYRRGFDNTTGFWQLGGRAVYAIPFNKTSFLHLEGFAFIKSPFTSFYSNERLFGYGYVNLRGLEYNVVDGMYGAALKTTLHKQLISFVLNNPVRSKTHDKIPFRIYLKTYGDLGYGYAANPNPSNTLNNKLLRSWGIGMDIVSIYDFVFKIEYSFNQLGRDGVYLHSRNDF
ncbi:MAG: hypothetical protein RLZZ28_1190 [Bacteroidota bacterium]|jgi:outer membrane protein assembly factor BamA